MLWISWLIAVFVLIILELSTASMFFFTCFALGAFAAGVLSFTGAPNIWQYVFFACISILSLFIIRPLFRKAMKKADTIKTNVDSLIGKNAVVTKKIVPLEDGFVKVDGEIWLAYGDEVFGEGDIVKVESVSGTKLKVKK